MGGQLIRVLLAEDMRLMREALAALLSYEGDIDVVAEVGCNGEVVPVALRYDPDVAVIDVDSMQLRGLGLAAALRDRVPACETVFVTRLRNSDWIRRIWSAHGRGLVWKDGPYAHLVEGIRRVATGDAFVDPELALALVDPGEIQLTRREIEILRLAAEGTPVAEIAAQLFLSVRTVRNYLSNVIHKTGARNRIEAIRIARGAGWL